MAGWEDLQDIGAFDFDGVVGEVDSLFEGGDDPGFGPPIQGLPTAYDLTMLGAAAMRVAVLEQSGEAPQRALEIQGPDARVAFLKFACARTFYHEVRPLTELQMPDVVPFSGDIAKLEAVGVSSVSDLAENFEAYFEALIGLYRGSASPLTRAVAESGWLHLESLIWRTTLWTISSPDEVPAVVDQHVARYSQYLGYLGRGLTA
jgi:hypothetical protein